MCDWFKLLSQFEIVSLKGILTETVKEYFGIIEKQNIYDKRFIGNCYSIILFNWKKSLKETVYYYSIQSI